MQNDSTPSDADTRKPAGRDWHPITLAQQQVLWDEVWADLLERAARRRRAREGQAATEAETAAPPPTKQRTRRPSPKRLAKWEAHWQAEQAGAEGDQ